MVNDPIYRTEVLIIQESKNYTGVIDLYENKCVVYNDDRVIDDFAFDITRTDIISDSCEVDFLGIYRKTKAYIQLTYRNKKSIRYFLTDSRRELFIGRFEQRKAECRNYRIVLGALNAGYEGATVDNTDRTDYKTDSPELPNSHYVRKPEDLNSWEDLLTPVEWRDYYHSLGMSGKKIYDAILTGIIEYKKSITLEGIRLKNDIVGVIYHYILWDNPAIFCIGEYAMWKAVEADERHIRITSLCGEKETEKQLRAVVLQEVKKVLNRPEIYDYSDIQKEKYIHDYIIKNWKYDLTCGNNGERLEPYTIYGAFVQKNAVCEGFAKATKLLLDILGVHTQVLSGTIKSKSAGHSWNTVRIGGKAYHLDVTFDLGQTGGHRYAVRCDYFNVAGEDLIDRTWNDQHVVWRCISQEHTYPACVGGLVTSAEELKKYFEKELSKRRAYMYVKLSGPLAEINQKKDYIWNLYRQVSFKTGSDAKAILIPTDIRNLYVMAVHY